MDPLSFIKSIWKSEEPIQTDTIRLRPGQIISGKIIQLFPNQMAEIQIGSHKLMAKLEASLLANQQYWFQVQEGEGKIRLKLLKGKSVDVLSTGLKDDPEYSVNVNNGLGGLIEQFITRIPLQLGPNISDLTMQWNGRKKENGKIDPDDCRIFFYLELKNIGELFVDLQIQNRKLSITMINGIIGGNLITEPQITILKENLRQLNYQLVSIKFEQPSSDKPLKSLLRKAPLPVLKDENPPEVDIRI